MLCWAISQTIENWTNDKASIWASQKKPFEYQSIWNLWTFRTISGPFTWLLLQRLVIFRFIGYLFELCTRECRSSDLCNLIQLIENQAINLPRWNNGESQWNIVLKVVTEPKQKKNGRTLSKGLNSLLVYDALCYTQCLRYTIGLRVILQYRKASFQSRIVNNAHYYY